MKNLFSKLSVILIITSFYGCASIVSRSWYPLTINTDPNGANVEITNRDGIVILNQKTPIVMTLKASSGYFKREFYQVKISFDGYSEKIIPVDCKLDGWYFGNIIFGGLIGMLIVDPATGAMYRLDKKTINETLSKITANNDQPSLKIVSINDLPNEMKDHIVSLNSPDK